MPRSFPFVSSSRKKKKQPKAEEVSLTRPQTPQTLGTGLSGLTARATSSSQQAIAEGKSSPSPPPDEQPQPSVATIGETLVASTTSQASTRNLWDEAWDSLAQESPDLTARFNDIVAKARGATSSVPTHDHDSLGRFIDQQLSSIKQRQWRLQLGKLSIGVRETIERVIGIITTTKDFATQVAALDPLHAGLPVAALCLMVTLVSRDKEEAERMAAGIELVAKLTERYLAIEAAYLEHQTEPPATSLRNAVVLLYKNLLLFQTSAVVHLDRNTGRRAAYATISTGSWSDMVTRITQAESDCEAQRQLLDSLHNKQGAAVLRDLLRQFADNVLEESRSFRKLQESWYVSERASRCMATLRRLDYHWYKNLNPSPTAGTCQWLTDHVAFHRWLSEPSYTCLWVTAAPGCGKSTYARHLVDDYLPSHAANASICYYFFKNDGEAASLATAICSILHQVFRSKETNFLLQHIETTYEANLDKLSGLVEELWMVLLSVVRDFCCGNLIIVIDALDECIERERLDLASKLRGLSLDSPPSSLKILLTSRPNPQIEDQLVFLAPACMSIIRLTGEWGSVSDAIAKEIETYITTRVEEFRVLRVARRKREDNAHAEVRAYVLAAPNRTYLWVSIVFQRLRQDFVGSDISLLRSHLRLLPPTVEESYDRMLNEVNDIHRRELATKMLSLILAARTPLSPAQLYTALYITENTKNWSELAPLQDDALQDHLMSLCGLFITFITQHSPNDRPSTKVFLIHETAREYLTRPAGNSECCQAHTRWKHSIDRKEAFSISARAGMLVLLLIPEREATGYTYGRQFEDLEVPDWLWSSLCDPDVFRLNLSSSGETRDAPVASWPQSFRQAQEHASSLIDLALEICRSQCEIKFYLSGVTHRDIWYCEDDVVGACIALDLPLALKRVLEDSPEHLNSTKHLHERTALNCCVLMGRNTCISLVLSMPKLDPNIPDDSGYTPLITAIRQGSVQAFKQILQTRDLAVNVNWRDHKGLTPLMHAAQRSEQTYLNLLLTHGDIDVNARDKEGLTALHYAVQRHSGTSVDTLLKGSKIDVNLRTNNGVTPLLLSSSLQRYGPTSSLIADARVDVNVQSYPSGRPALIWCSSYTTADASRLDSLVQALLQRDEIAINLQDEQGMSALHTAIAFGRAVAVAHLVRDHRTNINSHNHTHHTPLMDSSSEGRLDLVRLLLDRSGIEVNAQDHDGDVALKLTIENMIQDSRGNCRTNLEWREAVACSEALLRGGADPSITSARGSSPASWALCYGHKALLLIYREYGALPTFATDEMMDSCVGAWESILLWVSNYEHEPMLPMSQAIERPFETLVAHFLHKFNFDVTLIEDERDNWRKKHRRSRSWPPPCPKRQNEIKMPARDRSPRQKSSPSNDDGSDEKTKMVEDVEYQLEDGVHVPRLVFRPP